MRFWFTAAPCAVIVEDAALTAPWGPARGPRSTRRFNHYPFPANSHVTPPYVILAKDS